MADDFSSPAGSNPGAAKGEQPAAPGYAHGQAVCSICSAIFDPEAEPGITGVFGAFINVVFCADCLASTREMCRGLEVDNDE